MCSIAVLELTVVGAREYCKFYFINVGILCGSSLGEPHETSVVGPAHSELIAVSGEWLQPSRFNLPAVSHVMFVSSQ